MENIILTQIIIPIVCSILASTGLWAYLVKKAETRDLKSAVLVGLAHDRIMQLGGVYIERGYITKDEYENLRVYLFEPYEKLGGNGSAKRVMTEIDKLPIKSSYIQPRREETRQ